MNAPESIDRRRWLARLGCSGVLGFAATAGGPRLARAQTRTASADDARLDASRLVVVLLRGALDGLAAVPVPGDPQWSALRPPSEAALQHDGAALPLDGPFALHPRLATLHRWFLEQQLLVVHAVASPYRARSHFDAQQLLESGGNRVFEFDTGWIGRALQQSDRRGVALGTALPLALRGAARASSWAPSGTASTLDDDLIARIGQLYDGDSELHQAFAQARDLHSGPADALNRNDAAAGTGFVALAADAGRLLAAPDGPSLAWLECSGWDTHVQQVPRLSRQLEMLDRGLGALRASLGDCWANTTVIVMTEFGRSATLNGSGGTDHGTAGVAFLAGGAVAGGRVLADWPGLSRTQLLEGRDLRPTIDLRALLKPALQRHLGLSAADIERAILPGAPRSLTGLWRA